MAKKIFKYPIQVTDTQKVKMPALAEILTAQFQEGYGLCLWALVDPEMDVEEKTIVIYGTGHSTDLHDMNYNYIGTVQERNGALVWHVFELL